MAAGFQRESPGFSVSRGARGFWAEAERPRGLSVQRLPVGAWYVPRRVLAVKNLLVVCGFALFVFTVRLQDPPCLGASFP